jgi:hypothetical protein
MLIVYPRATGRGQTEIVIAENHDCVLYAMTPEHAVRFATSLLSIALEEAALSRSVLGLVDAPSEAVDSNGQS